MLSAKFFVLELGMIVGFELAGHSGYADFGKDIVCSAVSSAAYMTVNTITDVMGIPADVSVNESAGYMKMIIDPKNAALCKDILNGFKNHLLLLEEMYLKNINVSYTEV